MNKHGNFLNSIFNTFISLYFITNVLPIIILIIAIIFGIHYIFQTSIYMTMTDEEKANSIFYTKFENSIQKIAEKTLNSNDFELECNIGDAYSLYDIELTYIFKNKDLTAEQYDNLIKEQVTRVYNEIKDKKVVNDTFNRNPISTPLRIQFSFMYTCNYAKVESLCFLTLKYTDEDMYGNQYDEFMNKINISEETLSKYRK